MISVAPASAAILITAFNRREKTLECLRRLYTQESAPSFDVYLVDDASTDGTAEQVRCQFPQVRILKGDGSLFWSGGMRLAWDEAMKGDYQAYIWLNDDVALDEDALARLWAAYEGRTEHAILGGSMRELDGTVAYSGSVRTGIHPFRFRRLDPDEVAETPVDVLHGNLLLVPREVAKTVGGFAPYLVQQYGDYEYCTRAKRHGIPSILLSGTFGVCSDDHVRASQRGLAGLRRAASLKTCPLRVGVPLYREMAGSCWWFWLGAYYAKAFVVGF